ncbi:hypothetical protein TVAG_225910 [Trichomonas vaginalis G3]|uniref:Uncharacterized protein n=1 Tax=Trichomonas vaginalis (strain ATCC PRA-98 / G3) TaxID=412133 RepID=A2DNX0_TRIV3|nr:hypothetical protein TVAGG3_0289510 [Trichomonas vaginalis G3]EAY17965.1 hypothetical protein TVAG_225910 [Trichomonas vaginalis G3]KAI5527147.1 hypothetical protein TVAGG3_0289510 [Trichomonas vaginalis G3]|eukprot:XP_001578951.1 hypothetical protein [Trichomonas vaginalis G3]
MEKSEKRKFVVSRDVITVVDKDKSHEKGKFEISGYTIKEISNQESSERSLLIYSKSDEENTLENLIVRLTKLSFSTNIDNQILRHSFHYDKIIQYNNNLNSFVQEELRSELVKFLSGQNMMILTSDVEQGIGADEFYDSIQKCLSDINSSIVEKSRMKFEIKVTEKLCIISTSRSKLIVSCSRTKEDIIDHARIFRNESIHTCFSPNIKSIINNSKYPIRKIFLLFQRLGDHCDDILKLFSINSKSKIIHNPYLKENLNPNEQKNAKSSLLRDEYLKINC